MAVGISGCFNGLGCVFAGEGYPPVHYEWEELIKLRVGSNIDSNRFGSLVSREALNNGVRSALILRKMQHH